MSEVGSQRANQHRLMRWAIALFVLLSVCFGLVSIQSFLAVTSPSTHGVLVVEAWIPDSALAESVTTFNKGSYDHLVVVGGPAENATPGFPTLADYAAHKIQQLGIDSKHLVRLPVESSNERTLSSARTVKRWLETSEPLPRSVDVFTVGVHARKSWTIFRRVLGKEYQVGIIAGTEQSYDPHRWVLSRRGLWIVTRNFVGYLYSKFLVQP